MPDCVEPLCNSDEYVDPVEGCTCLSEDEFLDLFNHGFGEDCIPGTEDDPSNPHPCEDDPWGYFFDEEYCQCVAGEICEEFEGCLPGFVMSPLDKCSCTPQNVLDLFMEIVRGYGPDCIPGTPDDDDDDVGDDDCDEGYWFDWDIC